MSSGSDSDSDARMLTPRQMSSARNSKQFASPAGASASQRKSLPAQAARLSFAAAPKSSSRTPPARSSMASASPQINYAALSAIKPLASAGGSGFDAQLQARFDAERERFNANWQEGDKENGKGDNPSKRYEQILDVATTPILRGELIDKPMENAIAGDARMKASDAKLKALVAQLESRLERQALDHQAQHQAAMSALEKAVTARVHNEALSILRAELHSRQTAFDSALGEKADRIVVLESHLVDVQNASLQKDTLALEAQERQEAFLARVEASQSALEASQERVDELLEAVALRDGELVKAREAQHDLEATVSSQARAIEAHSASQSAQLQALASDLAASKQAEKDSEELLKGLEGQVDSLKATLARTQADLRQRDGSVESLEVRLGEVQRAHDVLRSQLDESSAALQVAQDEVSSLQTRLDQAQVARDALQVDLASQVLRSEERLDSLRASRDTMRGEHEIILEGMETRLAAGAEYLSRSERRCAELSGQLQATKAELDQAQNDLATVQDQLHRSQERAENEGGQVQALREQVESLQAAPVALLSNEEATELRLQVSALESLAAERLERAKEADRLARESALEVEDLLVKLEAESDKLIRCETDSAQMKKEVDLAIERQNAILVALQATIVAQNAEVEDLKAQVKDLEAQLAAQVGAEAVDLIQVELEEARIQTKVAEQRARDAQATEARMVERVADMKHALSLAQAELISKSLELEHAQSTLRGQAQMITTLQSATAGLVARNTPPKASSASAMVGQDAASLRKEGTPTPSRSALAAALASPGAAALLSPMGKFIAEKKDVFEALSASKPASALPSAAAGVAGAKRQRAGEGEEPNGPTPRVGKRLSFPKTTPNARLSFSGEEKDDEASFGPSRSRSAPSNGNDAAASSLLRANSASFDPNVGDKDVIDLTQSPFESAYTVEFLASPEEGVQCILASRPAPGGGREVLVKLASSTRRSELPWVPTELLSLGGRGSHAQMMAEFETRACALCGLHTPPAVSVPANHTLTPFAEGLVSPLNSGAFFPRSFGNRGDMVHFSCGAWGGLTQSHEGKAGWTLAGAAKMIKSVSAECSVCDDAHAGSKGKAFAHCVRCEATSHLQCMYVDDCRCLDGQRHLLAGEEMFALRTIAASAPKGSPRGGKGVPSTPYVQSLLRHQHAGGYSVASVSVVSATPAKTPRRGSQFQLLAAAAAPSPSVSSIAAAVAGTPSRSRSYSHASILQRDAPAAAAPVRQSKSLGSRKSVKKAVIASDSDDDDEISFGNHASAAADADTDDDSAAEEVTAAIPSRSAASRASTVGTVANATATSSLGARGPKPGDWLKNQSLLNIAPQRTSAGTANKLKGMFQFAPK